MTSKAGRVKAANYVSDLSGTTAVPARPCAFGIHFGRLAGFLGLFLTFFRCSFLRLPCLRFAAWCVWQNFRLAQSARCTTPRLECPVARVSTACRLRIL